MDLFEAMCTTFAAREFTDEAVDDATLWRILDRARFAPSGGNRQPWRVVVVRDAGTRERIAAAMEPAARRYVAQARAGESPLNTVRPSAVGAAEIARTEIPAVLMDWVRAAPVILVVGVDLSRVASVDAELDRVGVISGASVYPFVWNVLLAARAEGLGGTMTTLAAAGEPELKTHLGMPAEVALAAFVPLGQPVRQLTRLKRRPVEKFATLERFDGPALGDGGRE